jgi:hypothetical protein
MLACDDFDESWSEIDAQMPAAPFDVRDTASDRRGGQAGEVARQPPHDG